uniref:F-box domain-containing protein n=1 Tax=Kalanchoe fedtschenkoi TaxID=63787 RepID=A0A7N0V089_KALFE
MELISGLPDDVALECLIRTHYSDFSSMSAVSKSWKQQIEVPEFLRQRKMARKSRVVVALAQAIPDPDRIRSQKSYGSPPVYRVTLFEPETGTWSELPPPPGCSQGLPMFCRLAGSGSDLVVVGGWDPKTFGVSRSVFVYSFISATWRRGADMPGPARSFFGCAADGGRGVVYVAGGHDEGKNALRSVLAYDVAKDEWMGVNDMAGERDECHAVVHRGNLHVIGGYCSDMQGRFEKSAEVLDWETMRWGTVKTDFIEVAACHKTCTAQESDLYTCREGHVAAVDGEGKWRNAVEMAGGIGEVAYVGGWGEKKMVVIGTCNGGDTISGYVLDLKSMRWSEVGIPDKYSGNIHAGCCLEM